MLKFAASLGLALVITSTAHAVPIEMEDTDVRDFARWFANHEDLPLAIDPRVQGTLTVYADDVPAHELSDFVHGVLQAHGFEILYGNPPVLVPIETRNTSDPMDPNAPRRPQDFTQHLDIPQEPHATTLLALNNIRADDIAPLVTNFLTRTGTGSTNPPYAQVMHAANALLVSGPQDRLADLEQLLPQFDVSHAQVHIQALIFELTDGDTFDFGVSFGSTSTRPLAGGVNTRNLDNGLALPGFSFGIFDNDVLALAINAVQRNTSARILSTPQILTLSGKTGRISVGQNVPIITGRVTGQAADIENPFQTIERKDIGVTLNVTPVVTASGLIVMDVQTTADSLTDSLAASDIITNQRSIDTTVQIQSGQTVLLGGLVSEDTTESISSVPILGSIPGLGALFRSTSTSTENRKLYVLLQATEVLRHDT